MPGRVLGAVSWRKSRQHSANLDAKMEARSFKNQEKSNAKIDQKIDAFEDRFLMRSGRILGGKWSQVGTKIKEKSMLTLKGHFLEKTLFFPRKFNDFEGSRGCKIDGKSMKNRMKIEGGIGRPLDIDF